MSAVHPRERLPVRKTRPDYHLGYPQTTLLRQLGGMWGLSEGRYGSFSHNIKQPTKARLDVCEDQRISLVDMERQMSGSAV